MLGIALILFFLVLVIISGASSMVLLTLSRYALPDNKTARVKKIFILGNIVFLIAAIIIFIITPWNKL